MEEQFLSYHTFIPKTTSNQSEEINISKIVNRLYSTLNNKKEMYAKTKKDNYEKFLKSYCTFCPKINRNLNKTTGNEEKNLCKKLYNPNNTNDLNEHIKSQQRRMKDCTFTPDVSNSNYKFISNSYRPIQQRVHFISIKK